MSGNGDINQRFGHLAETAARHRHGLTADRDWYHDALTADGVAVEVKACRAYLSTGRKGRVWIARDVHEELLDCAGVYAIAVYDPTEHTLGPVLDVALISAFELETSGLLTWSNCGKGHHKAREAARITWSRLIGEDAEVPRLDDPTIEQFAAIAEVA